MKVRPILVSAVIACLMMAAPALAQQGVSPQVWSEYQQWLNQRPEARNNPSLMNDPNYLRQHPHFAQFLANHPNVRNQTSMGAYDSNHQWRDANWWQKNNPNWVYQNHPAWVQQHPEWRQQGDWDNQHKWHDKGWWQKNNSKWVEKNHPEWAKTGNKPHDHH